MKKILNLLFIFILASFWMIPIQAENPLEATKMNVDVVAKENGIYTITETLDMNFNQRRHGIYAEVPQYYENVKLNGKKFNFYMPISNIKVLSDQNYELQQDSNGFVLKFGSENTWLSGQHTFTYQYDMQMLPWGPEDMQFLYLNVISNRWQFPINELNFNIEMPKSLSWDPILYLNDDSGKSVIVNDNDDLIEMSTQEKILNIKVKQPLRGQALTVEQYLGKDYFKLRQPTRFHLFAILLLAFITNFIISQYFKYGKDYQVVRTVEFTAPDGLSSAETAYVYKGQVSSKDITSLIIYWASLGYLEIEELSKNNILLIKKNDMYAERPQEEKRVFDSLFAKGDEIETKSLENKFHSVVSFAQTAIPSDLEQRETVFEKEGQNRKALFNVVLLIISVLFLIILAYDTTPNITLALSSNFINFFWLLLTVSISNFVYVKDTNSTRSSIGLRIGQMLFAIIASALGIFIINFTAIGIKSSVFSLLVFMFLLQAGLYYSANMVRRSKQGTRWYGQILGLKKFIEVAEKDRLIKLVEETPSIFYDILPFAYVLGVTDIWSKKFENITIEAPSWYVGNNINSFNSYYMWRSINRSMNSVQKSMVSVPAPKAQSGGGGKFTGGGGFGGGGSAGGGFGGSGGGGW